MSKSAKVTVSLPAQVLEAAEARLARRGEIWWTHFGDVGPHPVVLISRNATYRLRNQATVALITSRFRDLPVEVLVGPEEGLSRDSAINVDNLATVPLAALTHSVGSLSPTGVRALDAALHFALGLRD